MYFARDFDIMYEGDKEPWVIFAYYACIFIVGVPSNILTLVVYCTKSRISHNQRMILTLAACDIFGCVALFPSLCFTVTGIYYTDVRCRTTSFLVSMANLLSTFLAAWVSVDQYRSVRNVTRPIGVTIRKDIFILTCICFFSVIVGGGPLVFLADLEPATATSHTACNLLKSRGTTLYIVIRAIVSISMMLLVIIYSIKIFQLVQKRRLQILPINKCSDNQVVRFSQQSERGYSVQFTNLNDLFTASSLRDEMTQQQGSCPPTTSPMGQSTSQYLPAALNTSGHRQVSMASSTSNLNTIEHSPDDICVTVAEQRNSEQRAPVVVVTQDQPSDIRFALSHVTKMLVLIAIITVITRIPSMMVIQMWNYRIVPLKSTHEGWFLFALVLRQLPAVNFATNPFVYCIINKSFRQDCASLFRR